MCFLFCSTQGNYLRVLGILSRFCKILLCNCDVLFFLHYPQTPPSCTLLESLVVIHHKAFNSPEHFLNLSCLLLRILPQPQVLVPSRWSYYQNIFIIVLFETYQRCISPPFSMEWEHSMGSHCPQDREKASSLRALHSWHLSIYRLSTLTHPRGHGLCQA